MRFNRREIDRTQPIKGDGANYLAEAPLPMILAEKAGVSSEFRIIRSVPFFENQRFAMALSADEQDAIQELVNIGIGRAAATLSELIGTRIELSVPTVRLSCLLSQSQVRERLRAVASLPALAIAQDFAGPCSGRAALVLPVQSAVRLARLLGGDANATASEADELDLELSGILTEVGNIMLNGLLGALANMLGVWLTYDVPQCHSDPVLALAPGAKFDTMTGLMVADAQFRVRQCQILGALMVVFEHGSLESVIEALSPSLFANGAAGEEVPA